MDTISAFSSKIRALFFDFQKTAGEASPRPPLVPRLTIMVVPMLAHHNAFICPLFDPIEVYKKVHSLGRVFIRKNYFYM